MKIEFKDCPASGLLMLDGVYTEKGEAFLKRQQSSAVEFKVIDPPRDTAQVARVRARMADIQQSIDTMRRQQNHVEPNHPVVTRGLALLARRATRGAANRK